MSRLTLLVLVDAFRPDYLRDAPFLSGLASESAVGRFREPFGFVPRAAYFGGLTPEQLGFSNMFRQAIGDSPFAAARALPPALLDALSPPFDARRFLDARARSLVTPYARYLSTMRVPAGILPHLAPVETRAPWDREAGYASLFHELDAAGVPWLAAAWPGTTTLPDTSDGGILTHVVETLEARHRFAFVHFQELDAAGHYHGPEAAALRAHVGVTDARVAALVRAALARFDAVDVVAFGDHGMVTVTTAVDVRPLLAGTGLVPGVDFLYFLDSTMVRLWHLTSRARPRLMDALGGCPGLVHLDEAARRRHRIAGCDPRNGHDIYLARPGVVVWPDFFATDPGRPKGMHGYDPDCADNQGIFLHWRSDGPRNPREAGVVDAVELYPLLRELTGLRAAAAAPDAVERAWVASRVTTYTQCDDPAADARVEADMTTIVREVGEVVRDAEAIVLTGSFGRGEGGMLRRATGWAPLNDYDILVIGPTDRTAELRALSTRLRTTFGLDYLDIVWSRDDLATRPLTIANFDLKYGSRVLAGDPAILERLPPYAAGELPPLEALMLLLNRAGGLLSGLTAAGDAPCAACRDAYLRNQLVKAATAIGDWWLVRWGAYDTSYARRGERVAALAPGAGLTAPVTQAVVTAYAMKVCPDRGLPADPEREVDALVPHLLDAITESCAAVAGRPLATLAEAAEAIGAMSGEWVTADNARVREMPAVAAIAGPDRNPAVSVRQTAYAGLPLLLAARVPGVDGARRGSHLRDGLEVMAPAFRFAVAASDDAAAWEAVRGPLVKAWLAMIH